MLLLAHVAAAQFTQQGSKLVGTGAVGPTTWQGNSVAISADGNTAIVGGPGDSLDAGAAWVFTRSGQVWSQQGSKMVGTGAAGTAQQGWSVAISGDGNTAIVGGPTDDYDADDSAFVGAAWVYTRSGGAWTQQGSKLVGTDAVGAAQQGVSVAISADGNTAIVGGEGDISFAGAAWVYTRSGGAWTQQGNKLVGWDAVGDAWQGWSVAISADGNTAIVGGYQDDFNAGAAWVYTRSGGVWTQQGNKLVGTGAIGAAQQGYSVAISADGNTGIVGGDAENFNAGAAWVYTRSAGVWSQQGGNLVGTGAAATAQQGWSVAISGDGSAAIVGGPTDNSFAGASWVFTRSGGVWTQQGNKLVGSGGAGAQGTSVAISADGNTAIVGGPTDYWAGAAWVFVANACTPPAITSEPQSLTAPNGEIVMLSVTATGTAPLSFQWYQGESGDTSMPVVGGNAASIALTAGRTATASFWVRVTDACGSADSVTATIAVMQMVRRHLHRAT